MVHKFEFHMQRLTLTLSEALKDPKNKAQHKKPIARVASASVGTNINSVTIKGTGISLGTQSKDRDNFDTPLGEAASLVERMVDMQCNMRQLYQQPRNCTRAHLHHARCEMRPYTHLVVVFGSGISQRATATVL